MNVVSNNKILNEKKIELIEWKQINIKKKVTVKNKYFKWRKYFYYKSQKNIII